MSPEPVLPQQRQPERDKPETIDEQFARMPQAPARRDGWTRGPDGRWHRPLRRARR